MNTQNVNTAASESSERYDEELSPKITQWMENTKSLLTTDKGYKVRHYAGREVHSTENKRLCFIVDSKGNLTEDNIIASEFGRLSSELVDITEQLRVEWLAKQSNGHCESNSWEARQEARRTRYIERADKARAEGISAQKQANDMLSRIPFGQPILVGHHSEKRHRNLLSKADGLYRKAFVKCEGKAEHYENKADGVGRAGISSDDPDAVCKLKEKLQKYIKNQELMKACNKVIKHFKTQEEQLTELVKLGISDINANELLKGDFCGRIGFASYSLQNNNAEINRLKKRISQLEVIKSETLDHREEYSNFIFETDSNENRLMFIFEGKPDENTRTILKSYAFKWSPTRGAWVRKITPNALYAARKVKESLLK